MGQQALKGGDTLRVRLAHRASHTHRDNYMRVVAAVSFYTLISRTSAFAAAASKRHVSFRERGPLLPHTLRMTTEESGLDALLATATSLRCIQVVQRSAKLRRWVSSCRLERFGMAALP